MIAFLACVFYAMYATSFLLCVVFTIVFMNPQLNMTLDMLLNMDIKDYDEKKMRRVVPLVFGCLTLVGKLLYLICWHFA